MSNIMSRNYITCLLIVPTHRSNFLWYSGFFINSIHKWPKIYLQMYYTSRSSSGCHKTYVKIYFLKVIIHAYSKNDENEEIGVCANISKRF